MNVKYEIAYWFDRVFKRRCWRVVLQPRTPFWIHDTEFRTQWEWRSVAIAVAREWGGAVEYQHRPFKHAHGKVEEVRLSRDSAL